MPAVWITEEYARDALLPYDAEQVPDAEFTPAIFKAQGWVTAFISPAIATKATAMTTIDDSAPLKLCVALYAAYFVARRRFMQRGPNVNQWVQDLRKDADLILEQIKLNPAKALAGTTVGSTAVGTVMGLQSSKENYFPTGTLLSETSTFIDPDELDHEADERGLPDSD